MENKSSQPSPEFLSYKFLEASKAAILVPHLFLAEAMNSGIFMTLETSKEPSNYLVFGIRENLTAMIGTYSDTRLIATYIEFDKKNVEIKSQLYIFDCDSEEFSDIKWPTLVDQIEEWSRGDRQELNLIDE